MSFVTRSAALLAALLAWPSYAQLVFNEVNYTEPGDESSEYIEIYNRGGAHILSPYQILFYNGASTMPAVYRTLQLTQSGTIPTRGYWVICTDPDKVPNCNQVLSIDSNFIQNGPRDALYLQRTPVRGNPTIIDRISYEGLIEGGIFVPQVTQLGDSDDVAGVSLARFPDGDLDDRLNPWGVRCSTPGEANVAAGSDCDADAGETVFANGFEGP